MAEEMNLEAETIEAPAAPAAPPEPPTPEPVADPDEAQAVEVGGAKMVPLPALKAARAEASALKEKAGKADEYAAWIAQNKPYVDFIQQNQHLLRQPQPQQAAPPEADPQLVQIARSLDFVKSDGTPDLDRARQHQTLVRQEARQMAQEVIAPLAVQTYSDRATQNWNAACQEKLPNGQQIDHGLLRTAWQEVQRQNPAILADPRAVRIVVNNVIAEQMRATPLAFNQPPAPGRPPVVTEAVGARQPRTGGGMNDTQRRIVEGRKIDDKKFTELTRDFAPGRMNVLEDD